MMPESITDLKNYSLGRKWTLIALQHRIHKSLATQKTIHDLLYLLRPNATFLRKALKCKLASYLENGEKLARRSFSLLLQPFIAKKLFTVAEEKRVNQRKLLHYGGAK